MPTVFDSYITERKFLGELPLSALKGSTIGIDVEHFYKQLMTTAKIKEPLPNALGGVQFSLKSMIISCIDTLREAEITPIFIFNGVSLPSEEKPFSKPDASNQMRLRAWEAYDGAHGDEAVNIFNEIGAVPFDSLSRYLSSILKSQEVDCMVAPYYAFAQLVYLQKHEKKYIDAIYGSSEVLLYDIDRVITTIDFSRGGIFSFVDKRSVMADMGNLGFDQFFDLGILCGLPFAPAFPIFDLQSINSLNRVRTLKDLIRSYGSGYAVVMAYVENPLVRDMKYPDIYRRAWAAVKYHPIATSTGRVELMTMANVPNDVHDFIGQRLPDEVFFYLMRGLVGPDILNALTSGEFIEKVPLDGGETKEYRKFLSDLEDMRSQSLNLLTQPLSRFYQAKPVEAVYWFEPNQKHSITHRLTPTIYQQVSDWNVLESSIRSRMKSLQFNKTDLQFAFLSLDEEKFAASTVTPKRVHEPITERKMADLLQTDTEVIANTFWRFLQVRSFVTGNHQLSPWGRAVVTAFKASRLEDDFAEPLLTAVELIRFNVLNGKPLSTPYTGRPVRGKEEEKMYAMLISQVASLVPINHKPIGFSGPLNRTLLAFNSFGAKYIKEARSMIEVVLLSLLANGDANRLGSIHWQKLENSLPFSHSNSSALGIAMETYFANLLEKSDPTDGPERTELKKSIKNYLIHTIDAEADIERGFRFWDVVVEAVKSAAKDGLIAEEDAKTFTNADSWVQERR
ncbi:temperature dependent protein affecting M2 dsRNA replication-domain-containing protein [Lipomyces oligophaga]|uniref:temperature dependent protein affecting M2 dsRNA replication-domain-containing protein n=1 Tax=Lipomyces oligophaga TaxID=45792 RepID=UPI0034CFC7F7